VTDIATHDSAPGTILVIEDDETNLYVLSSWLKRVGHTVTEAVDGAQGWLCWPREAPRCPTRWSSTSGCPT
jgi:CheY-like chemotaxis protein